MRVFAFSLFLPVLTNIYCWGLSRALEYQKVHLIKYTLSRLRLHLRALVRNHPLEPTSQSIHWKAKLDRSVYLFFSLIYFLFVHVPFAILWLSLSISCLVCSCFCVLFVSPVLTNIMNRDIIVSLALLLWSNFCSCPSFYPSYYYKK